MKRIIFATLLIGIIVSSCHKVLDIDPTQSITTDQAINDMAGVRKAVVGCYSALQATGLYGRNMVIVGDLASDNLVWTGTTLDYSQVDNLPVPADNGIIDGMWAAAYDGINRVNNVLYRMPGIPYTDTTERVNLEGELHFIRALFYFRLANLFGGVPLKTLPTLDLNSLNSKRDVLDSVYEFIKRDLIVAEQNLKASYNLGRADKFSAKASLARVYLSQYHLKGDKVLADSAYSKANTVIASGRFQLAPAFADLFQGNTSESVFEIAFDAQNFNRLAQYFYPRSLTGRYEIAPSPALIAAFDPSDARLDASIKTHEGKVYGAKYNEVASGADRVYVIRLAEMYLIRAEALAYTNGDVAQIQQDINTIRARAGLGATTAVEYADLRLAIENERRFEFAFEGHRWFDLVRTKRAASLLGIDDKYTLFPIPLSEMQTNNLMEQNPGY